MGSSLETYSKGLGWCLGFRVVLRVELSSQKQSQLYMVSGAKVELLGGRGNGELKTIQPLDLLVFARAPKDEYALA